MSDVAPNPPAADDAGIPMPPASFTFIVLSLRAQAEMQLGLMPLGKRGGCGMRPALFGAGNEVLRSLDRPKQLGMGGFSGFGILGSMLCEDRQERN